MPARPMLGWLLFGVLSAWTLACAVASPQWLADNQSLPTTLWANASNRD